MKGNNNMTDVFEWSLPKPKPFCLLSIKDKMAQSMVKL